MDRMESTSTQTIVASITRAIVEQRLTPGTKLAEQKLADQYGVSRTLVRQALFQLSQRSLVRMEPARGAFVAAPSVEEALQVFAVRRMLEVGVTREFIHRASAEDLLALRQQVEREETIMHHGETSARAVLHGDFHLCMAQRLGNQVLADLLSDLLARCTLVALMVRAKPQAALSHEDHAAILQALEARDEPLAVQRLELHLRRVEEALQLPASKSA